MLDLFRGTITFGDGRRGMIPPVGDNNVIVKKYFTGGGSMGNVGKNMIVSITSPVPHVKSVVNPEQTGGGADRETIEEARVRAPWMLKHRYRAVTLADYEQLSLEASGEIAKAHCFAEEGGVRIVVIPKMRGINRNSKLRLSSDLKNKVLNYLDKRRLIATKLAVMGPKYKSVYLTIKIVVRPEKYSVRREIEQTVYNNLILFFHPLQGGADNSGWPLGRSLHLSEIYYLLERIEGVDYVDYVKIAETINQSEDLKKIRMEDDNGEHTFPHVKNCEISSSIQ